MEGSTVSIISTRQGFHVTTALPDNGANGLCAAVRGVKCRRPVCAEAAMACVLDCASMGLQHLKGTTSHLPVSMDTVRQVFSLKPRPLQMK